jgi:HD domain
MYATSLALASGVTIPDSKIAREVTELVRDTENSLLFNHSSRVYYFSAATGKQKGLKFDAELLYVSAMFHDMGLTPKYSSAADRFEVDGANAAREFLRQHRISQQDRHSVDFDCPSHHTRYPSIHASGGCAIDQRRRDGCSRYRLLGIL